MPKILIYDDGVTSRFTIGALEKSLTRKVGEKTLASVSVERIHPSDIRRNDNWQAGTALFCLPGGRARDFREHLRQEGHDSLFRYIEQGGVFAGFCAGAFHAGTSIDFDYQSEEIRDCPGMGLFPGKCVGPIKEFIPHFNAEGVISACRVDVHGSVGDPNLYQELYWGGPRFVFDVKNHPQIKVHHTYASFSENNAAIISFRRGKGTVFLSSPHIEINRYDFLEYCKDYLPKSSRLKFEAGVNELFPPEHLRTQALEDLFEISGLQNELLDSEPQEILEMGEIKNRTARRSLAQEAPVFSAIELVQPTSMANYAL